MISIIVATSKNSVIGNKNEIPWYLPADLKHFSSTTRGNTVLMGRKTFESILQRLGHALPDRKNVILTTQKNFSAPNCVIVHSLEEALDKTEGENVFICGGAEIYSLTLPYADRILLTVVDMETDGDTFFNFDTTDWNLVSEEPHTSDEKNKFNYTFYEYEKRK